jgi:cytochrome P450
MDTDQSTPVPGPADSPWRQVQRWIEDPVGFWEECFARFGETFVVQLGSIGTTVLFSRPEDVRQIFGLPSDLFECRQYNGHYGQVMGDQSILVSDGSAHRRRKQLVGPPLLRRNAAGDAKVVWNITHEVIEDISVGDDFPTRPVAHNVMLWVMLEITFGRKYGEIAHEISNWFSTQVRPGHGSSGPWAQFVHLQPKLRELIEAATTKARGNPDPGSSLLFDALVLSRDASGDYLIDEEVQDHVFTLLIAGVDPPALALAWALYWLHETPGALGRLRDELEELGTEPDPGRILELPYLTAAFQETVRMYPVIATPTGRRLTAPISVGGREYEAGTTLLPCTHLVHRRAELYPDPDRFLPERFLGRSYAPFEYFPFGGGARYCLGSALAPVEVKVVLAAVLSRLVLAPAHSGPVRPARYGTLLAPSRGMKLVVESVRSDAAVS